MMWIMLIGQLGVDSLLDKAEEECSSIYGSAVVSDYPYLNLVRDIVFHIKVSGNIDEPIDVYVYDGGSPNAHACIKSIYISTGLIEGLIENDPPTREDTLKLAFVLAHEISHIHLGHTRAAVRVKKALGPDMYAFSREQELEADRYAMLLLIRGGYSVEDVSYAAKKSLKFMEKYEGEKLPSEAERLNHPTYTLRKRHISKLEEEIYRYVENYQRAVSDLQSGDPNRIDAAINTLKDMLNIFEGDVDILNSLSVAYIYKAKLTLAGIHGTAFEDMLFVSVTPTSARSENEEKALEKGFELLDIAQKYSEEILSIKGDDYKALNNLGVIYRLRGEYEPNRKKAKAYLDSAYFYMTKAVEVYRNLEERSPYVLSALYFNTGGALYTAYIRNIKPKDSPEKWFVKAARESEYMQVPFYKPHIYLALWYESKGMKKKANKEWSKIPQEYRLSNSKDVRILSTSLPSRDGFRVHIGSDRNLVIKRFGKPLYEEANRLNYSWGYVLLDEDGRLREVHVLGDNLKTSYGIHTGMSFRKVMKIYKEKVGSFPNYGSGVSASSSNKITFRVKNVWGEIVVMEFSRSNRNDDYVLTSIRVIG